MFALHQFWIASLALAMTIANRRFFTIRLCLLFVLCLSGASTWGLFVESPARARERIRVVTTTADLRSLTEAVGGDLVEAVSLVLPNFDAEEYQPKPQDALRLKDAALVVRVGLEYDLWFDRLLDAASVRELKRGGAGYVDASFGIAPLEVRGVAVGPSDGHAHGSGNPHYWLDPENAAFITANIMEGLARIDPAHTKSFETNRQAFLARLSAKLNEWEAKLAPLRTMPIIAYHNSWPYFARRFRLDFADFLEIKPGVPSTPSHLAAIIDTMRSRNVRLVVREPHEPERDVAFVAAKMGASVVVLAPSVGALPGAADYIALFDTDVAALLEAASVR
jgi:ABC-type Zn uptake system ZnuABC Zn-binding protein ZnuA